MTAPGPDRHAGAGTLRVAAVILAAGMGSRLGGVAKALIRIDGVPLVLRQLEALRGIGVAETDIVVVTGAHHEAIGAALAAVPGVRCVHNAAASAGQAGSVRLGLQATDRHADAVLLLLGDQPLLQSADLAALLAAFRDRTDQDFVMPWVDGACRGNPVLASGRVVQAILASDRFIACRDYMDAHPESVLRMDTRNDHYTVDIDHPQHLVDVATRLGLAVTLPAPDAAGPQDLHTQQHGAAQQAGPSLAARGDQGLAGPAGPTQTVAAPAGQTPGAAAPAWNYVQWAEHAAMENLKGRLATGDVLLAQANTLLSLLLVAIGGALAYAAKLFEPDHAGSPMAWGMAAVVAWLVVVAVNLILHCIVTRPTPVLYNEPRNIYRPELELTEAQIRGFELQNVQQRIDRTKARNTVVAWWLDRCRYAAIATPFVFALAAAIAG